MPQNDDDILNNLQNLMDEILFKDNAKTAPSDESIQIAATILLFEVAKVDGRIDRVEVAEMMKILARKFSLDTEQVGLLLEKASDSDDSSANLETLTGRLRERLGVDARLRLLKNFWGIAVADKIIDQREVDLISKMAGLLGLEENDTRQIQLEAENDLLGN